MRYSNPYTRVVYRTTLAVVQIVIELMLLAMLNSWNCFTVSFRAAPCRSSDCRSFVVASVGWLQPPQRCFQRRWLNRMCRSSYYSRSTGCRSSACDSFLLVANSVRLVCDWSSLAHWVRYLVKLKRNGYNFLRCSSRLSNSDCSWLCWAAMRRRAWIRLRAM